MVQHAVIVHLVVKHNVQLRVLVFVKAVQDVEDVPAALEVVAELVVPAVQEVVQVVITTVRAVLVAQIVAMAYVPGVAQMVVTQHV